jgi:hypothetical protein
MHRVAGLLVRSLRLAVDRVAVYLLLEGQDLARRLAAGDISLVVLAGQPVPRRIDLERRGPDGAGWVADRVVEVVVPWLALGVQAGDRLTLSILVTDREGHVIEQQPPHEPIEIDIPPRHLDDRHWRA